jgi:hypothetical protein
MSELRDRIAAVLRQELFGNGGDGDVEPEALADAVIRDLGLREESRGPVTAYRGGQYQDNQTLRRYVTEWTTHDE